MERMALRLQGSLLVRHAPSEVADAFCAARLGDEEGGRALRRSRASTRPRSWNVTARGSGWRPGRARRDLLPGLKRLRPPGRESRGPVLDAAGRGRRRDRGREEPVRRRRRRGAPYSPSNARPLPRGRPGRPPAGVTAPEARAAPPCPTTLHPAWRSSGHAESHEDVRCRTRARRGQLRDRRGHHGAAGVERRGQRHVAKLFLGLLDPGQRLGRGARSRSARLSRVPHARPGTRPSTTASRVASRRPSSSPTWPRSAACLRRRRGCGRRMCCATWACSRAVPADGHVLDRDEAAREARAGARPRSGDRVSRQGRPPASTRSAAARCSTSSGASAASSGSAS